MTVLVFLLEEPSAKIMLEGVLPRVLPPEVDVHYIVFEGKQDFTQAYGYAHAVLAKTG